MTREEVIASLGADDMAELSERQLQLASQAAMNKANSEALKKMKELLKDEMKNIGMALSTPPFVYQSPEIKIMAGCKVRYATLMKTQLDDAHTQLDEFVSRSDPNGIRTADFLNKMLLAHSVCAINDSDFGGVSLDPSEFQELRAAEPSRAGEVIASVRDARVNALGNLSQQLFQRLITHFQAFQLAVEEMANGSDMDDTLGN